MIRTLFICCLYCLIEIFAPFYIWAEKKADQYFEYQPIDKRFLHLPVKTGAPMVWVSMYIDDVFQYDFQVEIAPDKPDFFATVDLGRWEGKKLTLKAEGAIDDSKWSNWIRLSKDMADEETVYAEKYRPQFHFSPRRGWTNDPNGLLYYKGTYHLFYQHNPFGVAWGNMHWGHAVSNDLLTWKELPDAIVPDKNGVVYSGSAVVDWNNTSGLQPHPVKDKNGRIANPPLVAIYTSHGPGLRQEGVDATQSIAYSLDEGTTWIKYPGNPVLKQIGKDNRDPKVFWYQDRKDNKKGHWVMALYLEGEDFALLTSKDLIHWEKTCDIKDAGGSECPDLFELPVDGNKKETRWVFWVANGRYLLGSFDGETFVREEGPLVAKLGGKDNEYAAQSYSNIPEKDGRRIQFSWLSRGSYPDMPFNQQMSLPRNLSLRTTPDGVRIYIEPVKEIEKLRKPESLKLKGKLLGIDRPVPISGLNGELLDVAVEFDLNKKAEQSGIIGIEIQGIKTTYDVSRKMLDMEGIQTMIEPVNNKLALRFLFDRMSVEAYVNGGRIAIAKCFVPSEQRATPVVYGTKGLAAFSLTAYELRSVWQDIPEKRQTEELAVCGGHKILIIDPARSEGSDVKINWQWDISEATQLPEIYQKYLNPLDECKFVDNNTKLLVTASGGGVVLLDRKTKNILFYTYSPMAHSAELLPGGRIVVALSTHPDGNCIELYDIRKSEECLFRDTICSGHGVVWNQERERLYVLGGYDLRSYSLKNWDSEQPELQLEKTWKIPGASGHDLSIISKDALLLTEAWDAWVFNIPEERFSKFTPMSVPDMKSVNYNLKTKRLIYTKGENDEWWTHHVYLQNPYQVIRIPEIELYKVRTSEKYE